MKPKQPNPMRTLFNTTKWGHPNLLQQKLYISQQKKKFMSIPHPPPSSSCHLIGRVFLYMKGVSFGRIRRKDNYKRKKTTMTNLSWEIVHSNLTLFFPLAQNPKVQDPGLELRPINQPQREATSINLTLPILLRWNINTLPKESSLTLS